MTATQHAVPVIEGPLDSERWGSVGFRLGDDHSASMCRAATATMLQRFGLTWVTAQDGSGSSLVDDMQTIVSELVTNAQRYGGDSFPAGSFTLFHPGRWLHLTVHDKNPYQPYKEVARAYKELRSDTFLWSEGGRGLRTVIGLAEGHCGNLATGGDGDRVNPGKVMRVSMLLPNVTWGISRRCPWTGTTKGP
jgi:anti-sigma regulatory factor (Ser/Thr protein kinase)